MNKIQTTNLFENIPASSQEWFQTLLEKGCVKIERIVSRGHCSPEDFWYDQDWDEWVLLLRGSAGLAFEGRSEVRLGPGDCLLIPAGVRHRVAWTDAQSNTIWLAVHAYGGQSAG
jgi:cupin 2 domain-containing protein